MNSPLKFTAYALPDLGRDDLAAAGWDAYVITHRATGTVIGTVFGTPAHRKGRRMWHPGTVTGGEWIAPFTGASSDRDLVGQSMARDLGLLPALAPKAPAPLPEFMVRVLAARQAQAA